MPVVARDANDLAIGERNLFRILARELPGARRLDN